MPLSKLHTLKKAWEDKTLAPQVKRFGERHPRFTTSSDTLEVAPLYTPDDLQGDTASVEARYLEQLGFPGEYPFTRGVQPNMYRGRLWINRLAREAVVRPQLGSFFVHAARVNPIILKLLTAKIVSPTNRHSERSEA